MATQVFRGKAQVSGFVGSFDVILYPIQQTGKLTHDFEMEVVKDQNGQDAAWRSYNEKVEADLAMKLLGDTVAHAKAGGAFFAPLAVVTISGCDLSVWNTTYLILTGSDIALANDKTGDITFKLRRYIDSTQNTLFATTPS